MHEIKLQSGIRMPLIGLGTWNLTGEHCTQTVREALELGYRHIDTAHYYRNHQAIGKGIKKFDRSKLFITSKVWPNELDYHGVIESCERALRELDTPYLDLYLIHWPSQNMDLEGSLQAFKELRRQGKIKAFGVSNFSVDLLKETLRLTEIPVAVNQVEMNIHNQQKELLEFCKENDVQVVAYSPLARGRIERDELLRRIGAAHDKTPSQVALRWLIEKGAVVIPKASSTEHLEQNLELDFQLSPEEIALIDSSE